MDTYDPFNRLAIDYSKTRFKGAVVVCRLDLPFEKSEAVREALFNSKDDAKSQYQLFAKEILIEWNLIDEKKKSIPATEAGILLAPPALVKYAINTWGMAIWDVSAPLDDGSTPG